MENLTHRTFDVFFYGLNMDPEVLEAKGVIPRNGRRAFIDDHVIKLGAKAMLLRARSGRAHGMVFSLTHREMDTLYATLIEYRAEPYLAVHEDGTTLPVISMVHVEPPVASAEEKEYSLQWNALVRRLGLPPIGQDG